MAAKWTSEAVKRAIAESASKPRHQKVKESEVETETRERAAGGRAICGEMEERSSETSGQRQQGGGEMQTDSGTKYERELTLSLEITGTEEVPVLELLRGIRVLCGGLIACRATGARSYEVTMSHIKGKERLLDGFKIGSSNILAKELCNDELMVSFLNLPVYITDKEIIQKLEGWGVSAVSTIRRRMWPGTNIADGTRFLKVKFTDKVQSLPYSARFETAAGPEYFRVIHNRQVRVCRMCLQPGHILRECPEFSCHKCGVQGHYAGECSSSKARKIKKCEVCKNSTDECICNYSEADEVVEEDSMKEDTSEEESEREGEGCEGGSGTAQEAGGEASSPLKAQSAPREERSQTGMLGSSQGGLSVLSDPQRRGGDQGGDGLEKGPLPPSVPDSMVSGKTPSDKQPPAAEPPNAQAASTHSQPLLRGSTEDDSEMEIEIIKNIRKELSSTTPSARIKRKEKNQKGKM